MINSNHYHVWVTFVTAAGSRRTLKYVASGPAKIVSNFWVFNEIDSNGRVTFERSISTDVVTEMLQISDVDLKFRDSDIEEVVYETSEDVTTYHRDGSFYRRDKKSTTLND